MASDASFEISEEESPGSRKHGGSCKRTPREIEASKSNRDDLFPDTSWDEELKRQLKAGPEFFD